MTALPAARWADRWRRLVGRSVEEDLTRYQAPLARIREGAAALAGASDTDLRERGLALRTRAGQGAELATLRDELFALVQVAAPRAVGLTPFDEQIVAGLAMSEGKVVDMQTGEGKTLAAVAPVALAALAGSGAHVLTFNDYLARRDAAWMGPLYGRLGLEVAAVAQTSSAAERRRAYAADVTYVTAREAGFDFLRDNLALEPADLVHRPFSFALVDEADSLLVDEARIPLVIATLATHMATDEPRPPSGAERLAELVRRLRPGWDFDTDERRRNVMLTERGTQVVEQALACGNLYEADNQELLADVRNALHAEHLLARDRDYIVRDGRVELVDDFTGRVADRRQWPDGLQGAVEVKERVQLKSEGRILGSITMQHFVRGYPRLCGMTATARLAAEELATFYGLPVTVIPTHAPCRRRDDADLVFTHATAKRRAVVAEVARVHATGRPVLVGTASVAESEELGLSAGGTGSRSCRPRREGSGPP
jgi:preprotein translocase subunit SecA